MATNGIVSVVKNGRVAVKFVAGCDGDKAGILAERIRRVKSVPNEIKECFDLALNAGFGCQECLVVVSELKAVFQGDYSEPPLSYRETFSNPEFNPRWDNGQAEFLEIVNI